MSHSICLPLSDWFHSVGSSLGPIISCFLAVSPREPEGQPRSWSRGLELSQLPGSWGRRPSLGRVCAGGTLPGPDAGLGSCWDDSGRRVHSCPLFSFGTRTRREAHASYLLIADNHHPVDCPSKVWIEPFQTFTDYTPKSISFSNHRIKVLTHRSLTAGLDACHLPKCYFSTASALHWGSSTPLTRVDSQHTRLLTTCFLCAQRTYMPWDTEWGRQTHP